MTTTKFKLLPPAGLREVLYGGCVVPQFGDTAMPVDAGGLELTDETEAANLIEHNRWTVAPGSPTPRSRIALRADFCARGAALVAERLQLKATELRGRIKPVVVDGIAIPVLDLTPEEMTDPATRELAQRLVTELQQGAPDAPKEG